MGRPNTRQVVLETVETILELQLKSIRMLLGHEESPMQPVRRRQRQRKSLVDLSIDILTKEGRPLHVDELVRILKERHDRVTDRDSLSSALAKKARQGIRVFRVARATFAVREDG